MTKRELERALLCPDCGTYGMYVHFVKNDTSSDISCNCPNCGDYIDDDSVYYNISKYVYTDNGVVFYILPNNGAPSYC